MADIRRGEIYFIHRAGKTEGSEQKADRPAVIVSNNKNNMYSEVVEVVFLTTKPKTSLPTHFTTEQALRKSTVLCEQINSVSVERIGAWIGTLTDEEMGNLDECLAESLEIQRTQKAQALADAGKEYREKAEEAAEKEKAWKKQAETYKGLYEYMLAQKLQEVEA